MLYDAKIALVLRQDLASWQKLNVAAFLASAIASQFPDPHGQPLVSASGTAYLSFLELPIRVYQAEGVAGLQRAAVRYEGGSRKRSRGSQLCRRDEEQPLVGLAMYGDSKLVNRTLDELKLHD